MGDDPEIHRILDKAGIKPSESIVERVRWLVECRPVWHHDGAERLEDALSENDRLRAENQALLDRRSELLALVARITRETPYPAELDECRASRAALIAEIGTLRARLKEARRGSLAVDLEQTLDQNPEDP